MVYVDRDGNTPIAGACDMQSYSSPLVYKNVKNKSKTKFQFDNDGFDATSMEYSYVIGGTKITTVATCEAAKKAVSKSVRPNNIGVGSWNKMLTNETEKITKFSDTFAGRSLKGGKSGVLDRLSYVGAALDVGAGIYDNVKTGSSIEKTSTDAVVDGVVSGASIWGAGLAGAGIGSLLGTACPGLGNIIGAVAGFVIGIGIYIFTDVIKIKGKSMRDWLKYGAENLVCSIENLINGGGSECLG